MIACPHCHSAAEKRSDTLCRCRSCRKYFTPEEALHRERRRSRGPKDIVMSERKAPYKGTPAGRITIPSYRWGSTRLG